MVHADGTRGRLTPEQWNRMMPPNCSHDNEGPWYYRDVEVVSLTYLTDENAALDILPDDLELVLPATAFLMISRNHWSTNGEYGEVFTGVVCKYDNEIYGYVSGSYVTSPLVMTLGREIFGFGKKYATNIDLKLLANGQMQALVEIIPGHIAAKAVVELQANEAASTLQSFPFICLKLIPDAEGGDKPSLAQLVSTTFAAIPHVGPDGKSEIYSGPATLEVDGTSDLGLPILRVIDGKYMRMTADLPYGRVLKTF
jgi:acetoacetate decarboxylase